MIPFLNRGGGEPSQLQRSGAPPLSNPHVRAPTSEFQPGQRVNAPLDIPGGDTQTFALGEPVSIVDLMGQCERGNLGLGETSGGGAEAAVDIGGLPGVPGHLPIQIPPLPPYSHERGGGVQTGEVQKFQMQSLTDEVAVFEAGNEVIIKAKNKDNGNDLAGGGNCNFQIPATVHLEEVNHDPSGRAELKNVMDFKFVGSRGTRTSMGAEIRDEDSAREDGILLKLGDQLVQGNPYLSVEDEGLQVLASAWTDLRFGITLPRGHLCNSLSWTRELQNLKNKRIANLQPKFCGGKKIKGFVTDPEKIGVDQFDTKNFWHVGLEIVQNILDNLELGLLLGGYFCEGR